MYNRTVPNCTIRLTDFIPEKGNLNFKFYPKTKANLGSEVDFFPSVPPLFRYPRSTFRRISAVSVPVTGQETVMHWRTSSPEELQLLRRSLWASGGVLFLHCLNH